MKRALSTMATPPPFKDPLKDTLQKTDTAWDGKNVQPWEKSSLERSCWTVET